MRYPVRKPMEETPKVWTTWNGTLRGDPWLENLDRDHVEGNPWRETL
jgi:hypothetical protein